MVTPRLSSRLYARKCEDNQTLSYPIPEQNDTPKKANLQRAQPSTQTQKTPTLSRDLGLHMVFRNRFCRLDFQRLRSSPTLLTRSFSLPVALTFLLSAFVDIGCKSKECVPGQQVACACPGGTRGVQACDAEGSKYLPCICTAPQFLTTPTTTAPPIPAALPRKKQIRCGKLFCESACCATFDPPSCAANPRTCPRSDLGEAVIYECDGPEDCASGQACCLVPGKTVIGAVCVPRQECTGSFPHPRYQQIVTAKKVCHNNSDCDVSETCGDSGDSSSILTCNK
jgi:hypothetical protein